MLKDRDVMVGLLTFLTAAAGVVAKLLDRK